MNPSFSIIVPFRGDVATLALALRAVAAFECSEIILVSDDASTDCECLALAYGARVIRLSRQSGPAAARNAAAALAKGEILVFVDADVVVSRAGFSRMRRVVAERPDIAAFFGAYDDRPGASGFMSQYKNLSHAFVHQTSAGVARTF